jgi:hypothetical protein
MKITEVIENKFIIDVPETGITIKFNGYEARVEVSPFYFSEMCGICGDFNGEQTNEFEGPDKTLFEDVTMFANSYVIPDDNCKSIPHIDQALINYNNIME